MPLPLAIPIIMSLASAAAQGVGAVKSAQENKKNQYLTNNRQAELDKELYQSVLDDPGSQAYLRTLDRNLRDSIQGIENSAVSTGATQENVLAQKRAANEVTSDAIGNLLQREDAKRDNLLNRQANLDAQQMAINSQKAQNWANTASAISSAANSVASAYMMGEKSLFDNPQTTGSMTEKYPKQTASLNNYAKNVSQQGLDNTIEKQVMDRVRQGNPTLNIRPR